MATHHHHTYSEHALDVLKRRGLRITKPRCLVIELLDTAANPLSPQEIKDLLAKRGEQVDAVSVYRILDCLEENHLLHRVITNGKVQKCALKHEDNCTLKQEEHCHHFLICQKCGRIEEVHCPGTHALVETLETGSGFKIQSHTMEFSGLCPNCQ